jgi:4a-hydroxytetrahydrobiopterin dehydratase
MSSSTEVLTAQQTVAALRDTAFVHLGGELLGGFTTADFVTATRLVVQVTEVAESSNHHPDIELGYGKISFRLSSHDVGGVTERDLDLAMQIQALATDMGASAQTRLPATFEIAIDSVQADSIRAFWRIGLDYDEVESDGDYRLVDPRGRGPAIWFQHMDVARTDRNRIHLDVYLPAENAEARVRAIEEAGGTLLSAEHAPDWWVMADVDGNELCVCT